MKVFAELGGKSWPTKKSVVERCRLLLKATPANERVNPSNHLFLLDLLQRHPRSNDKIGVGVSHFEVRVINFRGSIRQRAFFVVRNDATAIDFSFYKCLERRDERADFLDGLREACRHAVVHEVHAFKRKAFSKIESPICPLSGMQLQWDDAHVDHDDPWPFRRIFDEWVSCENPSSNCLIRQKTHSELAEPQRSRFVEFHDERARLRLLHKTANMSRG